MKAMNKSYSELIKLKTFEERYNYLKLDGKVGEETFGYDRIFNQLLYNSPKYKTARNKVLIRDNGLDMGMEGFEIVGRVIVHHINPITMDDIVRDDPVLYDPENLISVSHNTHNAIHYSNEDILAKPPIERTEYDTCPWKKVKRK